MKEAGSLPNIAGMYCVICTILICVQAYTSIVGSFIELTRLRDSYGRALFGEAKSRGKQETMKMLHYVHPYRRMHLLNVSVR